jgi:glycosidase
VFKTGHVLALTSVGIPIVYYGSEQYFTGGNDPNNREILWRNLDKYNERNLETLRCISICKLSSMHVRNTRSGTPIK